MLSPFSHHTHRVRRCNCFAQHVLDLCGWLDLDGGIHLCLPAIRIGRCRGLLVLQQADNDANYLCYWQIDQIPFGHRGKGLLCHNYIQNTAIDIDLSLCQVSFML